MRNFWNVGRVFAVAAAILFPVAAQAQRVLTAVESELDGDGPAQTKVGNTPGQLLSTSYGWADTRAISDYGVNKIHARGNAQYEQYAVSSWVDQFTVGGAAGSTVNVSFTFAVDGNAGFGGDSDASFGFKVYALRGGSWSLSGFDRDGGGFGRPIGDGAFYERVVATQTLPTRVTQADLRVFDGFSNFGNSNGAPGAFVSNVRYVAGGPNGDYFAVESPQQAQNPVVGGPGFETRYYATGFQNFRDGVPLTIVIPYSANVQTRA